MGTRSRSKLCSKLRQWARRRGPRRLLFLPIAPGGGRGGEGHSTALQQKLDGLLAMVQAVLSNNRTVQLEVTTQSRKLLSIVVPIFVKHLNSHSEDVHEQAVGALGNVGGDFRKCRDLVLGHGGLFPLLQQLNEHLSMLRNATWTLSNYCRRKTTKL